MARSRRPGRARTTVRATAMLAGIAALTASCTPGLPSVGGTSAVAPRPGSAWTPPASARRAVPAPSRVAVPADLGVRIQRLTLADIVDLGLRNNPSTRISWANARAAAATYGSARGAYFPTIDGQVTATRLQTTATEGRAAVEQSVLEPSLSLAYQLFDFGGRSGSVREAREALYAAGFTHNAVLQDVVLQIQVAYFQYVANRGLVAAQRTTLEEARANLEAAEERRRVGVATIADVLQARTFFSQAQLDVQRTEGSVLTSRGALALSLGYPANLPYDIDTAAAGRPVGQLADSVETLINQALDQRPDLAAARASYEAARARVSQFRAERLPSLQLSAAGGRTYAPRIPDGANSYSLALGLRIPIFAGLSRAYDQLSAQADADAAVVRAEALGQQVAFEVFSSYYDLQTAARSVRAAGDLVASAEQSSEVARARYREGVGSVLDLLSAQSALASARAQEVQSRLDWNSALARLTHDVGVLDAGGTGNLRLTPDSTGSGPDQ